MPLFMDIHKNVSDTTTPQDVAAAHHLDVEAQGVYGVKYLRWWFNQELGSLYCLVDAPNAAAAINVHRAAHGLLADEIIPVEGGMVDDFIGPDGHGAAVREDPPDRISTDTAFRTIVFTDLEGSADTTQRLGDEAMLQLLKTHDDLMHSCLEQHGGSRVKHTGDGIMASFTSVARAIECMIAMQSALAEHTATTPDLPLRARMGAAAGEPLSHQEDLFGAAVQLAAGLCAYAQPGQIMVAGVVRDLCIGKTFAFQEHSQVQLKGFSEPVRLFEVRWREADEGEAALLPYSAAATARIGAVSVPSFAAGRYTVTRLLGEGAQKVVYLVHDAALERDCALALLKTDVLDADSLARVRREGQAMARLTHPNIVTVHDIGDEVGRPYLVCEFVSGGDLRNELDRAGGSLPLKRALAIAEDLCSALAFAHSQGIIHRDVKPSNVYVARDGSAKLGDFGLTLAADQSRLTMVGTAMGTAAYMAPEQARGQPVDARTDLYSLGCLLYELITGRPPFTGDDPMAVVSQHVHAVPEPPSHHNAEVSRDLEQLVLCLMAKAKEERPSSADEALAELKRIAAAS